MTTIVVADDDPHILDVVRYALEKAGFNVVEALDGAQALKQYNASCDMLILDIHMPEMDGLEVCRQIRKHSDVPILFLSSCDEEIDRVLGLELGADDYVTKPFSPRELVARVKAILKRSQPKQMHPENILRVGELVLHQELFQVSWEGKDITFTSTEFAMLAGMMRQPKRVFTRDQMMDMAYDSNIYVSDRTIDSHIRNIRQKLADAGCKDAVQTVRGVGYKLAL